MCYRSIAVWGVQRGYTQLIAPPPGELAYPAWCSDALRRDAINVDIASVERAV